MQESDMKRSCVDLFSGCGGLSLGLQSAGFDCIFAIEAHANAFQTYKKNLLDRKDGRSLWPDWLPIEPIDAVDFADRYKDYLSELNGKIDLVAGGPPCQGFSTNGRRNPDDPRSRMVEAYLQIAEHIRPNLILIENVRGFTSMPHADGGNYADVVEFRLQEMGYQTWSDVLIASDWGVPQRRPRYFCIAAKEGTLPGIDPFERLRTARKGFLSTRGLWPGPTTAKDALSDLEIGENTHTPDPEWGKQGFSAVVRHDNIALSAYQRLIRVGQEGQPDDRRIPRHSAKIAERMHEIIRTCQLGVSLKPADRTRLGIGKRSTTPLAPDAPAPTVTTLPDDMIHYSDARTMSVREMARLQSFPDWFSFCGPYTTGGSRRRDACPKYTQVGNAVPPLLAEAIGETLVGLLADQKHPKVPKSAKLGEKALPITLEVSHG